MKESIGPGAAQHSPPMNTTELADYAMHSLSLSRIPVGIALVSAAAVVETVVKRRMPCQALFAASEGRIVTLNRANTLCFGSRYHLGLGEPRSWRAEFLVKEERLFNSCAVPDVENSVEGDPSRSCSIAPWSSFKCAPDLVLFPWQVMRFLVLAASRRGAFEMRVDFSSTCRAVIEVTRQTSQIGVSLIDATARRYFVFSSA